MPNSNFTIILSISKYLAYIKKSLGVSGKVKIFQYTDISIIPTLQSDINENQLYNNL